MLIPQFSIRWLFGTTALTAIVCAIVAWGLAGSRWALAVSVGFGSAVLFLLVYALFFAVIWGLSLLSSRPAESGRSPFQSSSPTRPS